MDKFKEINDKFGHKIGDIALKITASIIEDAVGEEDIVARLGGDEFAVILPGADQKTAAGVCKEIERRIEEYNKNSKIKIAVSTGYATRDDSATGLDKVLIEADKMMYRNKRAKQADN
jgi:diguanylate cyclase (GGDEF)-like protein